VAEVTAKKGFGKKPDVLFNRYLITYLNLSDSFIGFPFAHDAVTA